MIFYRVAVSRTCQAVPLTLFQLAFNINFKGLNVASMSMKAVERFVAVQADNSGYKVKHGWLACPVIQAIIIQLNIILNEYKVISMEIIRLQADQMKMK